MSLKSHNKFTSILSAMFLVAGTCIGGGMLALPVATGISGFFPSIVVMLICWMAMTATALLLLEVSLWMEEGVHVISMTSRLMGKGGKWVSWCLYLFICYASIVAYTAGGGAQMAFTISSNYGIQLSREWGCLIFITMFGGVIYLGSLMVGRVNALLFIGMVGAYIALVGMGVSEVKPALLANHNWSNALLALPLLLTSFSFQTMVPSLTPYLKQHVNNLRLAIIGGTFIAFLVYAIWQGLILGIVPVEGPHGLAAALAHGEPATQFIDYHVKSVGVKKVAEFFAFFAIITSFLGIGLGLFDFLADGLQIPKVGKGGVLLGLLIVVPTLIFSTKFERIFLVALDSSGGYGDTILNGLIPVIMVWMGRYKRGYLHSIQLPGGKVVLVTIFLFFSLVLCMEILAHTGVITSIYDIYDMIDINIPELKET